MRRVQRQLFAARWLALSASIFLLPCVLMAQGDSQSAFVSGNIDQQFAAISVSLSKTADSLLRPGEAGPDVIVGRYAIQPGATGMKPQSPSLPSGATATLGKLRPILAPILQEEGVPEELAGVVRIESGGNPMALSPKGARGLWQLMPDTARRYGLVVDGSRDDRLDTNLATHAAARYLRDLYVQFRSWPLALAAYNTGEQNVQRAIKRSHSYDFSVLIGLMLFPVETRNYVPAVLGAMPSLTQLSSTCAPTNTVFAVSTQ